LNWEKGVDWNLGDIVKFCGSERGVSFLSSVS
jgi:hypothetical protein